MSKNESTNGLMKVIPILISYIGAAAVVYLVYRTGGTPNAYANIMYLLIAIVSCLYSVPNSIIFALICGVGVGPIEAIVLEQTSWSFSLAWGVRVFIYIAIALLVSAFSTDNRKRSAEMMNLATTDRFTGLNNYEALQQEILFDDRSVSLVTLSVVDGNDLQGFFGYTFYNKIIASFSNEIQKALTAYPHAQIFHDSGLEFSVLVRHPNEKDNLEDLIVTLSKLNETTLNVENVPVFIAFRGGFATHEKGETMERLMSRSNVAMRYSFMKELRICRFSPGMEDYYRGIVSIASEFPNALSNNSIQAAYQTVHRGGTYEVGGIELLAKWVRKDGTRMMADEFVPVIEQTAVIHDLTIFMTKRLIEYSKLPQYKDLPISINLTAEDINEKNIMEFIRTLKEANVDPAKVLVELRGNFASDLHQTRENLQFLRNHGVSIVIDGFGAGMANYGLVTDLPIDIIKIDRSLISKVTTESGLALVKSIIDFAKSSAIEVVAEGIENRKLAEICTSLGADYLQGYYFSTPSLLCDTFEDEGGDSEDNE